MKFWIARDKKFNCVALYTTKPIKVEDEWGGYFKAEISKEILLGVDVYPEITWENSPKEVELKIKL